MLLYGIMITNEDIKRLELPNLSPDEIRRITNTEKACKNATSNWGKNFWFNTFRILCEKYGAMNYFRKVIH